MNVTVIDEVPAEDYVEIGLERGELLRMLRKMLEIRRFEERVEKLFLQGLLIGPSHFYLGEEAVAVGVTSALSKDDVVISTYRGHGHAIARGVPIDALMAELFGKKTGTCKGLSGSMHAATSVEHGIPIATAIVGSGIPIAVGVGLAISYRKEKRAVAVFFGDGAANTGAFHEGLNLAAVWKLPVIFVCENNFYAEFTAHKDSFAGESIAARGACYGVKSFQVYGNDVIAVYKAVKEALEHVKSGKGPAFLECRTYRKKGHGVYDTAWYRPKEEVEEWMRRDPIDNFAAKLKKLGYLTDEEFEEMDSEIEKALDEAVEKAEEAPVLPFEELWKLVYVSGEVKD